MRFGRLRDPSPAPSPARRLAFTVDGVAATAVEGDTVATALLAAGIGATRRSPVSGAPRAAYCLMGVCFECLVEIDGVPNRQGCLVPVADGMAVRRQNDRPDLAGGAE